MAEEGKKISFGFAKSIKKPILKGTVPLEQKKVDYIECLDEKAIKVVGGEEKKEEPLVIPLLGSKTWHDRIVNKIDADIFEPKVNNSENQKYAGAIKEEKPDLSNGSGSPSKPIETIEIKLEPVEVKKEPVSNEETTLSLEEQAAKEIIEDLKSRDKQPTQTEELTLPLAEEEEKLRGKAESTLEDYEKIPVDVFGLAMLRGMGWKPGKGIGKNEKIVAAVVPELRPKGMGLGADKVALKKQPTDTKKSEEELKIEKGSFVKFVAGKQSDTYGEIEGLDEDAGRLIVKMALGGNIVSVNEFMVRPVTKAEYIKNSKVLNAKKFEEYKDKKTTTKKEVSCSDMSDDDEDESRNHKKDKKKSSKHKVNEKDGKSRKRASSESESNGDYDKRARRRSRSSSSESRKVKKSKKSKKHKKHDGSSERSSKKHKKDKDRERTRDKKSRDSEHTDRKKRKKHRRSRSRS